MTLILIIFSILAFLLSLAAYTLKEKNRFLCRIFLVLFALSLMGQLIYQHNSSNAMVNEVNLNTNKMFLSLNEITNLLKNEFNKVTPSSDKLPSYTLLSELTISDVKYVQLDNDPELEILIHIKKHIVPFREPNFFILDFQNGKWKISLEEKNIEDYVLKNNPYLVLTTYLTGVGTGVSQSMFLIYHNDGSKYDLVLNQTKESINAEFNTDIVKKSIADISFINNNLIYNKTLTNFKETSTITETKQNTIEYILKNGKFGILKGAE